MLDMTVPHRTGPIPDAPLTSASAASRAMVVAVEATRLAREVRGIGRYVRAMLPRLLAQRPGLRLVLFVRRQREFAELSALFAESPLLRDNVSLRPIREMQSSQADVFWYPWNIASPVPARGAVVVTMHDVAPLAIPDPRLLAWRKNLRWRMRYRATVRRATLIVADSSFTADEIGRVLGVPRERMRVVLLAADDFTAPSPSHDATALDRLGVHAPFVLAVGASDRRKNLALLERAMELVVATHPDATLVLAGPRRKSKSSAPPAAWKRAVGFVSDDDLVALYRGASALVMPSSYEGFGLPVLEAMQLGTPVICVRASSLPEVAGDAAAWVEADDDAQLAAAISQVLSDDRVSRTMRAASLEQAARFTWDQTARQTLAAFDEALALASPSQG
jgi:glycosyltransferase involved in cell wall biosynthesis